MNNNDAGSDTLDTRKPDPPGEDFFLGSQHFHCPQSFPGPHRFISTNDISSTMISAVTDPPTDPPSLTNLKSNLPKSYFPNAESNVSNANSNDHCHSAYASVGTSGDTPCRYANDDLQLLTKQYSTHNDMMKHFLQYASDKGFIPSHNVKGCFDSNSFKKYFPQDNHNNQQCPPSLGSFYTSRQQPRKGYFSCSPKSSGRIKDVSCCCFKALLFFQLD